MCVLWLLFCSFWASYLCYFVDLFSIAAEIFVDLLSIVGIWMLYGVAGVFVQSIAHESHVSHVRSHVLLFLMKASTPKLGPIFSNNLLLGFFLFSQLLLFFYLKL